MLRFTWSGVKTVDAMVVPMESLVAVVMDGKMVAKWGHYEEVWLVL